MAGAFWIFSPRGCSGARTERNRPDATIGSLVLVPSDAKDAAVIVEVVTGVGKSARSCTAGHLESCIVARRRVSFRKHVGIDLPIEMRSECLGVACPDGQTCLLGTCRTADVDAPTFCDETTCGAADGGTVVDGSVPPPPEASTDAGSACPGTETGPLLLATNAANAGLAKNLVVTATSVYWADGVNTVWSVPRNGGASQAVHAAETTPAYVAHDGTNLFWTGRSGLRGMGPDGVAVTISARAQPAGGGPIVANDSRVGLVYWADTQTGQLVLTRFGGGVGVDTTALANLVGAPLLSLATDGKRVAAIAATVALDLLDHATGIPLQPSIPNDVEQYVLVGVDGNVIAAARSDGSIVVIDGAVSAHLINVISGPGTTPTAFVLSGTDVIVAYENPGNTPLLRTYSLVSGQQVRTLSTGHIVKALAVDGPCVYWAETDTGNMWKATR